METRHRGCGLRQEMNDPPIHNKASASLGLVLIVVALLFLVFSRDISETGLGGNNDLGSRALPVGLALCLMAGGLWELGSWLWRRF